jgi:hypothetical protein
LIPPQNPSTHILKVHDSFINLEHVLQGSPKKGEDNRSITTLNLVKGALFEGEGFDQWQVIGVWEQI